MPLAVGSTFSGIEGFGVGFEKAGMDVVWQCEADERCRELLTSKWPGVPVHDDVRTVHGQGWCGEGEGFPEARCERCLPRVDVLCGGFPCTDVSVAGKRAGLAGERSGLFWEFARLVAELAPRWFVIENVPGLLSSCGCVECRAEAGSDLALGEDGEDAGIITAKPDHRGRDMAAIVGTLTELGYGVAWRCLDAQYFNLAQRRERVFIVGCLGDPARAAQVLLEPESCDGDSPPSREAREDVAGPLGGGTGSRGFCDDPDRSGAFIPEIAPTLQAGGNSTGGTRPPGTTVDTCESLIPELAHAIRAQGQLAHREDVDTSNRYEGVHVLPVGDEGRLAVVPAVARCLTHHSGRDDGESDTFIPELAATLSTANGVSANAGGRRKEDDVNLVAYPVAMRGRAGGTDAELGEEGLFNALRAGDGGSSRSQWVAFSENQRGEVLETDYARQMTTGGGKSGQGYPAVRQGMAVRRLVPVECERLQGFDDDWTSAFPDSVRYRMLGNAVPTPVTNWIGKRIVALA